MTDDAKDDRKRSRASRRRMRVAMPVGSSGQQEVAAAMADALEDILRAERGGA